MSARAVVLRVVLLLFAVAIFLGTGEIALRVVYRDAGKRTLGGPGGRSFEHLSIRGDQRGRLDAGPKKSGAPRIMIVGDSITWGQGVRDWENTWPEQLARALENAGTPHEMAVLAMPGRDIPAHVAEVEGWIGHVNPDVFIYQWYVNDIEVEPRRPRTVRSWQQWSGHEPLRQRSYLYYFLDNRLATYLPAPDRSYVDYILQDFAPGTLEWTEFERYFHALATRAKKAATRILVIYPQVPFRGTAPLKSIYDRVAALAGPHRLTIPPAGWIRYSGALMDRVDAAPRQVLHVASPATGPLIETRDYYFPAGSLDVIVTVSIDPMTPGTPGTLGTFGTLDLVDAATGAVLSTSRLAAQPRAGWQEVSAQVTVPAKSGGARIRINAGTVAPFSVAQIDIPVDYGFSVVDLSEPLNTFNTHASTFDAHPNERAHRVVAEKVFEALQKTATGR